MCNRPGICANQLTRITPIAFVRKGVRVQPLQDPGEPGGETASANDLERDKERML